MCFRERVCVLPRGKTTARTFSWSDHPSMLVGRGVQVCQMRGRRKERKVIAVATASTSRPAIMRFDIM